jgi:hypothetical protein
MSEQIVNALVEGRFLMGGEDNFALSETLTLDTIKSNRVQQRRVPPS